MSEANNESSNAPGNRFLEGRVAVVTGASRGIGRAIAIQMAKRGASIAAIATSAGNCADTVSQCEAAGVKALAYGVDVSKTDAVSACVKQISGDLGGLDILVNNAGVTRDQLLLRMSEADFDDVISINLKGTWNFVRAASRLLMKSPQGRIVNISSVVGITGNAGQSNYAASKAGVIGLTRSLAKELSARKVCVNAVAPGFIATDMTSGLDENVQSQLLASIPLKRIGTPEEIAHTVDFLVGPGGAYVTGQTLVVDGGLSL